MASLSPQRTSSSRSSASRRRTSTNKDKDFFASIESIDTPDPLTIVLNFKEPELRALFHLGTNTSVIIDEKSAATEATTPVGTGPYKLASWTKGASITLDKWDGYRDPARIPIAHATFRFITDPSAAVEAMLAGDVDAFPRFANLQALAQFRGDPRFQVTVGGTDGKTIVAINNKNTPLDNLKVRQAIAYAIDRKAIMDGAMDGLGAPIGSHMTRTNPVYVDLTGMYPHDPEKAKALLKEAGVTTPLHRASSSRRRTIRVKAVRSSPPNSRTSESTLISRMSNGRSGAPAC